MYADAVIAAVRDQSASDSSLLHSLECNSLSNNSIPGWTRAVYNEHSAIWTKPSPTTSIHTIRVIDIITSIQTVQQTQIFGSYNYTVAPV